MQITTSSQTYGTIYHNCGYLLSFKGICCGYLFIWKKTQSFEILEEIRYTVEMYQQLCQTSMTEIFEGL